MIRAVWNKTVLAETPRTVRLEGNHYFPPESLHVEHFIDSAAKSVCPWKGLARYYSVTANGEVNPDAAWYYPHPSPLARRIKNHVAFWNGVTIEGEPETGSPELRTPRGGLAGQQHVATRRQNMKPTVAEDLAPTRRSTANSALPMWRIGITGGLVGILCCAGPTVLALFGIVSATTALAWANNLYGNYAWWFRLGGLGVLVLLAWIALRRRNQCSIADIRRLRWRLATVLAIAIGTYGALYALTTWLERFA